MTAKEKVTILPNTPNLNSIEQFLESEAEPRRKKTSRSRFFRFMTRTLFFFGALFLVMALLIGYWAKKFYAPIAVEQADASHLVGWLALRDLGSEKPEIRSALAEKYFEPIREDIQVDWNDPLAKKLIPFTKKYVQQREQVLADWEKQRDRRPLLRRDYTIDVASAAERLTLLSTDIRPSDELTAELDRLKNAGKTAVPPAQTTIERNIRVIMKNWFLYNMQKYDAAPPSGQFAVIESTAEQMQRLQKLFNDYLEQLGLKRLNDLEMMREFDFTVSSWYDGADPNELARLLWFKDLVLTVIVAQKAGLTPLGDRLIRRPSASGGGAGSLLRPFVERALDEFGGGLRGDSSKKPADSTEKIDENKPDFF